MINIIDIKEKSNWKNIFINKSGLPSQSHDYGKFCALNSSENVYLLDINSPKFNTFCPININNYKGFKILKALPGYSGFNTDLNNIFFNMINKFFYENKILSFYFNSSPYVKNVISQTSRFSSFKNNCYILKINDEKNQFKEKINRNIKRNINKTESLQIEINEVSKLDFDVLKKLYIKTCNRLNLDSNSFYKKDQFIRLFLYELIEFYFVTKISLNDISFSNRFLKKINNVKKFNLDDETLFLEFKSKVLNG